MIGNFKCENHFLTFYIFDGSGTHNFPYHFCEQIGKEIRDISDEIPFEIPESWEWCRLGTAMINRDSERIPLSVAEREKLDKVYDYYGASGVIDKVDKYLFNTPLLLIGEDGANLLLRSKPIAFIAKGKYWVNNHAHVLDTVGGLSMEYICTYINAINLSPYVTGTAQPKMNQEKMNSILVPLPPLAEQCRIVTKIKELLPYIEQYEQAETKLAKLNADFPEALKKSILQEAVQGRLVPQNSDDEPASVLLEHIRAEKQALIKAGKIKKDKHESVIITRDKIPYEIIDGKERCIAHEVPFEIPESWCWCRLGTIFQHNTGKALNSSNHQGAKMKYITTSNLYWDRFELDKLKEMLFTENELEKCTVNKGDLLVCEGGDIGRAAIWNYDYSMRIQNHIHKLRPYTSVEMYFFYYIFYLYKRAGLIGGKGIGIQGLSSNVIDKLLIPLPPLAEQKRIVAKIEELMPIINRISK